MVRTLRCGRSNPGSNPGLGRKWAILLTFLLILFWIIVILVPYFVAKFPYTVQTHKSLKVKSIGWINSSICQSKNEHFADKIMTPTWLEHAAFWSGVRRATIAPRSLHSIIDIMEALYNSIIVLSGTTWNVIRSTSVGGIVVSIAAFQAVDPGSIPGQRKLFFLFLFSDPFWEWRWLYWRKSRASVAQ